MHNVDDIFYRDIYIQSHSLRSVVRRLLKETPLTRSICRACPFCPSPLPPSLHPHQKTPRQRLMSSPHLQGYLNMPTAQPQSHIAMLVCFLTITWEVTFVQIFGFEHWINWQKYLVNFMKYMLFLNCIVCIVYFVSWCTQFEKGSRYPYYKLD